MQDEARQTVDMKRERVNEQMDDLYQVVDGLVANAERARDELEAGDDAPSLEYLLSLLGDLEQQTRKVEREQRRFEAEVDELEMARTYLAEATHE